MLVDGDFCIINLLLPMSLLLFFYISVPFTVHFLTLLRADGTNCVNSEKDMS